MTSNEADLSCVGWPRVSLGELGELYCGQSPASSAVNTEGHGVPYVSGPEQWDGTTLHLGKWTTEARRVVPVGCVFVTVKGAGVGTVFPGVQAAIGRDIYAFKPNEKADARFVEHALRHSVAEVVRSARGDIPGLSKHHLLEHEIALPSLEDQKKTVDEIEKQFTRLDAGVAALDRVQVNLKRYRAAVLKAACVGRLVPTEGELARREGRSYETGDQLLRRILAERQARWNGRGAYEQPARADLTALPQLPDGWVWARLEQLGVVFGGLTKNPRRARLPKKLPYLRVANVYANELRLEEIEVIGVADAEMAKLLVEPGDLLIVEGNGSKNQIGRLAIWDGSIEPCVHQNHLIKVRLVDPQLGKWILYWLLSPSGRSLVEVVASSTSGLYTLSVNKVGDLPIAIPPLPEQTRVVEEIERRFSVADELKAGAAANLQRATRLRQSVLQRAFSGTLVSRRRDPSCQGAVLRRSGAEDLP